MRVRTHVTRERDIAFDDEYFRRVIEETVERCPSELLAGKEAVELNVVVVSPEKIQELNRMYRGKDAVTDVLSFGEYADTETLRVVSTSQVFLGEIFLCYEVIMAVAKEDRVEEVREMTYVLSHGVLHLLGYDHGDEMFGIQDDVTTTVTKSYHGTKKKN